MFTDNKNQDFWWKQFGSAFNESGNPGGTKSTCGGLSDLLKKCDFGGTFEEVRDGRLWIWSIIEKYWYKYARICLGKWKNTLRCCQIVKIMMFGGQLTHLIILEAHNQLMEACHQPRPIKPPLEENI